MPRKITVAIGRTYNLGNFESLRFDIGLEDEASPEVDEGTLYQECKSILAAWERDQRVGKKGGL